jgi:hypothetical protein
VNRHPVIDVAIRFPRTSLREAYERSKKTERWVFPETICSSVTLIYGRSNVGKSYLVASMLLSLLIEGRDFLGMQPTDPEKLWKPAILWTDPGSDEEYADRIYADLQDDDDRVVVRQVGKTTQADEWQALTESLLAEGVNFVVLDNLMGVTGDTNDPSAVTTVFDGLTRLLPVVVVHHESEHGLTIPGGPPMGASVTVQKARTWIQVRQTARRKLHGGNMALVIQSNALPQPQQLVAEPLTGSNYRVLNRGPWVRQEEGDRPSQVDKNAQIAAWVVENCQGVGTNQVSQKVAEAFGKSPSTCKDLIMRGKVSNLLVRTGEGDSTAWRLTA